MVEHLWDLSETDADEQRVLSQKEREFLMTGDSGTYTYAEMERRVATKAAKLSDRIQQLIDDVSLLYYRGNLSGEDVQVWEDLSTINNRSRDVRDSPVARTTHQIPGDETDLGFELGTLIRMIHEEPVPANLVWGTIVGLIGEPSEEWEREAGRLVDLFDQLEDYYEWRLVSAGTQAHEDDGFQEERDEIREILREHEFAPAPPVVDAILEEYTKSGPSGRFETTKKSWQADPSQTEHPTPPDEMPSEAEMRRTTFETIISKFADQTSLPAVDRLAKDLREDAIRIQNREWRGVDPDQAFQLVGRKGEAQIQEFEQTETKGQNNMTTALRRLSNDDSNWVNRPALRENQGEKSLWQFTPYGELLYEARIKHNCSTNWIYEFIINPEQVNEGVYQLISDVLNGS
ncbi:hypothetical protein C488_14577 [Natrinema pellirubrum DSM 15624]|uniref:Uncharacterized protein n=1 Tax=Natrinema pellirubrum (strain DSM 15624 / CIP 106293 / JCM 10476 / NCIMB 786 / 157) TaxID=797303 RepID=L0JKA5_NATP1|nr:hypothetical protein [Natrinema pellirubrum]AGB31704.1 hypothetical protein Natpe_1828 [Natrinema pellirubrum DSM 15624]ELY72914.1 hypothetical protein C488_14577 [Natrinema pellirubrum DSM 15624]